jgi:hypothetical protein
VLGRGRDADVGPTGEDRCGAAVEGSGLLEEFFSKVSEGGDIAALAQEYDAKITPLLNGVG